MTSRKTRETQFQVVIDVAERHGAERMGLQTSESWRKDPRHLVFNLSRYKFVAKMLSGRERVLEIGCGDAFGSRIVRQEVANLTATDFDPVFIEDAKRHASDQWPIAYLTHDLASGPVAGSFDAIYALDVLEHVPPAEETRFMENALASLDAHGVAILGMPSLESQAYASEISRKGHVNCKSMPDFKKFMLKHFYSVFMFSMNDEVVHTGFHRMANYLFAVGASKR